MRLASFFIFIFIFSQHSQASEQCEQPTFIKNSIDKMADDWFGLKCDPLDNKTWPGWPNSAWKSPCDCIKKGEKFTRIKEVFFKKNRQKREDLMKQLLEKKVAEVLRTQIDNGFEQSLRLDTLLKQGAFKIEDKAEFRSAYPKSCRISKIKDTIKDLQGKDVTKCDQKILNKRLKTLLNGKTNFDDYYKEKNDTYGFASLNMLSPQDKKKGMCIPYKSFQSLNNQNPYKKTYLAVAKLKNFKEFQQWATNRSKPNDVFDLVAKDVESKRFIEASKVSIAKGGSRFPSQNRTMPGLERFVQENDSTNGLEEMDREAILHLIKTDPIFERMVKDEKFFNEVAKDGLLNEGNDKEKKLVKALMKSQDSQCKNLFGESKVSGNEGAGSIPVSTATIGSGRGGKKAAPTPASIAPSANEKSLLEQYLCEEDFPAKFANEDSIRNVLAPEFKEVGEIKGIKHTEWILAKWAYCSPDQVSESDDGNDIAGIFENGEKPKMTDPKELYKLLDLSLNPKSDLESTEGINNQYKSFNKAVCDFVPEKCKDSDAKMVDFECSTAHVADNIITNMLGGAYKGKDELSDVTAKVNDFKYSDKELRESIGRIRAIIP